MARRLRKILLWILLALLLLAGAGFVMFLNAPPKPAPIVDAGATGRRVTENGLFANYFPAPGPGKKPAILLLGGSEGGLGEAVRREALLLQAAGFNVLHLGYFNLPGKNGYLAKVPLEEFYRGIEWLKGQPEVDADAIGLVGYSKGAEAGLLVASRRHDVKAVVAGMPSSVAWDGMSMRSYIFGGVSSWTEGGKRVPSLPYGSGEGKEELLPRFVNGLNHLDAHPDTVIPVERFAGQLLLICGERDTLWPSCLMARQIEARAKRGRPLSGRETDGRTPAREGPDVTLLVYPDAGHGVMGAPSPASDPALRKWSALGGTPEANAAARADGWPRIVAFLNGALRGPAD